MLRATSRSVAEKSGSYFYRIHQKKTLRPCKITYRVHIRSTGAPSISESFPTRRAAKEWSVKMEADVRQGRYFGREESKERAFAELVERYGQQMVPAIQNLMTR